MPIDPSMAVGAGNPMTIQGIGSIETPDRAPASGGEGGGAFGGVLSEQIGNLSHIQDQAASATQALATGQASDPVSVVTAVERARLSMQLASQIRSKATEAYTDVFHTQV